MLAHRGWGVGLRGMYVVGHFLISSRKVWCGAALKRATSSANISVGRVADVGNTAAATGLVLRLVHEVSSHKIRVCPARPLRGPAPGGVFRPPLKPTGA